MAQTITPELARALLGGEPLYLVLYGWTGVGGPITKPLYAIPSRMLYAVPLRDCAAPYGSRVDFNIPPLVLDIDVTITRAAYAAHRNGTYVELQEIEVTSLPAKLRAEDSFRVSGLYISMS